MPTMAERIKGALNSAQARKLMESGRRQLAKPSTQQKLRQRMQRITGRSTRRR